MRILDRLGVVIITGEPGVGKTTLADHLCLHYVTRGFDYLKIADDIQEAESAFDTDSKQVIYFDDFLGRNYLEALKGHEGNQITQFLRRVSANKNKRFVLTSRSTILNQGKFLIDCFEHGNVQRNEYELQIKSLTDLDKAQILYNHIWHSGLTEEYIDQLYFNRQYRKIIEHKNFNPRLISYITDISRLETIPSENYWNYIVRSLTNPSQIWDNPFNAQQDDYGRAIILLTVLNGGPLDEKILAESYHRYLALPENQNLHGRRDFQSNIKLLTGSFLNRVVQASALSMIDLFNPSIGDYVLKRYAGDVRALRLGFQSLGTVRSTITLRSLQADRYLSVAETNSICDALIKRLAEDNFADVSAAYISALCDVYRGCGGFKDSSSAALRAAVLFIVNECIDAEINSSFEVIKWGIKQGIATPEQALQFIANNIDTVHSSIEIQVMQSLLSVIPETTLRYGEISQSAKGHVIELMSDNLYEFIEVYDAFSGVDYGDDETAGNKLERLIVEELAKLVVDYDENDVSSILEIFDVSHALKEYFENLCEDDDHEYEGPTVLAIDEIDDLFDRDR